MYTVVLIMLIGVAVGKFLIRRQFPFIGTLINVLIWVLLFLLGVEVGSDERIVKGIATLGVEGIVIALAGVAGSSVLAWLLWKWSKR